MDDQGMIACKMLIPESKMIYRCPNKSQRMKMKNFRIEHFKERRLKYSFTFTAFLESLLSCYIPVSI